jgi:hypothetical protein
MPQPVQTIREPNVGTATSSGRCWQFQHDTSSDRTPSSRMLPSVIGSIGWSKRGIRLVLIRRTRARRPGRKGLCFVGLQPANMVDNHLVVWLAWFDVEDSLGKRAVTLDGSQAYRERQVRSHEHGSDYVSRSGRRLLREGTGNGKGKGGQNNCPPDHLKASPRERLAFTTLYHARARFSSSAPSGASSARPRTPSVRRRSRPCARAAQES